MPDEATSLDTIMSQGRPVFEPDGKTTRPDDRQAPASAAVQEPPAPGAHDAPATAPRFKDHEAAEEGYRHVQSQLGKTVEEKKKLEERLAEFERREAEARAQEEARQREMELRARAKEANKKALADIAALDPDSPDHEDRVAEIWADCNTKVLGQSQPSPVPAVSTPSSTDSAPSMPDADARIAAALEAAGMPADDPVFFGLAVNAPRERDGQPLTFEQQLEETIKQTKAYHAAQRTRLLAEVSQPLTRGGSHAGAVPPGAAPAAAQPVTLAAALAANRDARRLS